jgi:hypothetical protein
MAGKPGDVFTAVGLLELHLPTLGFKYMGCPLD